MRALCLLCAAVVMLGGCDADGSAIGTDDDRVADPTPSTPEPREPAESAELGDPVVVRVPALGIEAKLQPLGLDRRGQLRPPAYGRAGWYADGPEPGEPGAAVIAGHLDSATGPDVFATLAQARRGHRVLVDLEDGAAVTFRVVDAGRFPQRKFPTQRVYADVGRPVLRLITCGGEYDADAGRYLDNVVVFAEAVSGPGVRSLPSTVPGA